MSTPIRISAVFTGDDARSQFRDTLNGMVSDAESAGRRISDALSGSGQYDMRARMDDIMRRVGGVTSASQQLGNVWQGMTRNVIAFSAGLFAVERIARGMKEAFTGPYDAIMRASEAQEKFRLSLAGTVTNPLAVANAVDRYATSSNSTLSLDTMRRVATGLTHSDILSSQFALQSPDAALQTVQQLADIVQRLGVSNPQMQSEQIQRALETVLESGDSRGLRTLRIDRADLQQIAGTNSLKNPTEMLAALSQLMRQRVPDSVLQQAAGLPSNQLQHARDDWNLLLASIGNDSNLLSSVSAKFKEIGEAINEYILSPEWAARARSIGDDMGRIAGNILDAGASLLQHASGAKDKASTPDAVAAQVEELMHSLAAGSDSLVPVAGKAGDALHGLAGAVQAFLHSITLASEDVQERTARFDSRSNFASYLSPSAYIDQTNQRSEAIISLVDKLAGKPVLDADPMTAVEATQRLSAGEPLLKQLFYRLPQGWIAGLDGNPQVTGIKADGAWADFASDAAQQIVAGGYAAQGGRFVSEGRITDSILLPLAKKYGLQLGQASSAGGASASQGQRESFESLLAKQYDTSGINSLFSLGDDIYGQKFSGINRAIGLLGPETDKTDKLAKVLDDGAEALNAVFAKFRITTNPSEVPGSFFDKIHEFQRNQINQLEDKRGGLLELVNHYGKTSEYGSQSQALLDKIDQIESRLTTQLAPTLKAALDKLGEGAGRWNVSYIEALKGEDPAVRDTEISRVMAGNTDVGRRIAAARLGTTNLTPEQLRQYGGAGTIPSAEQARSVMDEIEAHLANLKLQGLYTNTSQANSIFGPGVAGQQAAYLRSMLPGMESQMSGMTGIDAERMAAAIAKVRNEMTELEVSSNSALKSFLDFGKQSTDTIENGLGNALADVISGTQKVSTAFRAMANEILHEFTNMTVHAAFSQLPGSSGNPTPMGGGLLGGIVSFIHGLGGGGGGDSKGNSPNIGGGPSVWSVSPSDSAANGAVWIPGYSAGGVARSPTILVGERSDGIPEAIVPMTAGGRIPLGVGPDGPHAILPSGQRIPGSFVGYASGGILGNVGGSSTSGGLHVHNYFVSSEAEAQAHASSNAMSESDVVNIVSRDLMRGGPTYRAVQRGGGR